MPPLNPEVQKHKNMSTAGLHRPFKKEKGARRRTRRRRKRARRRRSIRAKEIHAEDSDTAERDRESNLKELKRRRRKLSQIEPPASSCLLFLPLFERPYLFIADRYDDGEVFARGLEFFSSGQEWESRDLQQMINHAAVGSLHCACTPAEGKKKKKEDGEETLQSTASWGERGERTLLLKTRKVSERRREPDLQTSEEEEEQGKKKKQRSGSSSGGKRVSKKKGRDE